MIGLVNVYIAVSFAAFFVTAYNHFTRYDNYFAFALSYWAEPTTNIILYNFCLASMILFQKVIVALIFTQMKENEKTKILEKLKLKSLQFLFMAIILHDQFTFPVFALSLGLVVSFVLHHLTVLRSEYLINTHNLYMGEHLRLLSFYVALLFVDYEVLKHSWNWIVSQNNMSIVFSFYVLQMCLLLLEPCIKFSIYLYERFTGYEINELDAKLNIIGFAINLPRLVILNFLGFWVMIRFRFSFFFIFVIIELVVEFLQLIKNFTKIRGLSKIMDTLPKISREEIELKRLDDTCMVCFRQIHEGVLVPSCSHIFHNECLKQWIHKNTNHFCPKCKKPFDFPEKKQKQQEIQPEAIIRADNQQLQQPEDVPEKTNIENDLLNQQIQQDGTNKFTGKTQRMTRQNKINYDDLQQKSGLQEEIIEEGARNNKVPINKPAQKRIGSMAYGLPHQAIYYRTASDFAFRKNIKKLNEGILSFLDQNDKTRMLLIS